MCDLRDCHHKICHQGESFVLDTKFVLVEHEKEQNVHVVAIHFLVFVANDLQGIAESCMNFFDNKHERSKLHMKNVCLFERERGDANPREDCGYTSNWEIQCSHFILMVNHFFFICEVNITLNIFDLYTKYSSKEFYVET